MKGGAPGHPPWQKFKWKYAGAPGTHFMGSSANKKQNEGWRTRQFWTDHKN
jgi:hypothetical protein